MIELAALAVLAVTVLVALSLGLAALKLVVWTLLLPVRVLLGLVFLPFLLLKAVFGGLLLLVIGPIVAIAAAALLFAVISALLVPLLPILALAFILWVVLRASDRPTAIIRS